MVIVKTVQAIFISKKCPVHKTEENNNNKKKP